MARTRGALKRTAADRTHDSMPSVRRRIDIRDQLIQRVCGEFLEMPGLRLTCGQAQRLLGLDNQTCVWLLEFLVESGFLCKQDNTYARRTDGHGECPRPRPVEALLDGTVPREATALPVTPVRRDQFEEFEPPPIDLNGSLGPLEDDIRLAARVTVPVLVTAADPKQRSLCARLIHATGARVRGPFVTFSANGAASTAENGNGGARVNDIGNALMLRHQFEQAREGTLFVDDIITLKADAQAQFLSLLGEHVLSQSSPGTRSVRVVAGASHHLDTDHATGAFCMPLFYRLNVIHLDFINHQPREAPQRSIG